MDFFRDQEYSGQKHVQADCPVYGVGFGLRGLIKFQDLQYSGDEGWDLGLGGLGLGFGAPSVGSLLNTHLNKYIHVCI